MADEPIHWITRSPSGVGNVTACGKRHVYPMGGNGWRVRDITCDDCDSVICDILHENRALYSPPVPNKGGK